MLQLSKHAERHATAFVVAGSFYGIHFSYCLCKQGFYSATELLQQDLVTADPRVSISRLTQDTTPPEGLIPSQWFQATPQARLRIQSQVKNREWAEFTWSLTNMIQACLLEGITGDFFSSFAALSTSCRSEWAATADDIPTKNLFWEYAAGQRCFWKVSIFFFSSDDMTWIQITN